MLSRRKALLGMASLATVLNGKCVGFCKTFEQIFEWSIKSKFDFLERSIKCDITNQLCVFTKPFNSLSFDELSDQIAALGFDGVEAPIRAGGHIEPEAIPDQLPKLVAALEKRNLRITIMTSGINDPDDPLTESSLRVAADCGIKFYRMQYFKYDENKPIRDQLSNFRAKLQDLAALNETIGITGLYQNHAGRNYFGAGLWDLAESLEGVSPEHLGVAYDIRHATVEGGMSWPVTFRMIRPLISAVYVKDFTWRKEKRPANVPLGVGRVDPEFFQLLAETDFSGPISLHEEYLDHRKPELVPEHLEAMKTDLAQLQEWLDQ